MELQLKAKYQEMLVAANDPATTNVVPPIGVRYKGKERIKSLQWIADNPVEAIVKYHQESLFDMTEAECRACVSALSLKFDGKAREPKFQKGTGGGYQMDAAELAGLMNRSSAAAGTGDESTATTANRKKAAPTKEK